MTNKSGAFRLRLYRKIVALYPKPFRERFGASMEQTFRDLCAEQDRSAEPSLLLLWPHLADTLIGVGRENVLQMMNLLESFGPLRSPGAAALISVLLFAPIGIPLLVFISGFEPLIGYLKLLLTFDGQQINTLGRIVLLSGIVLLPVALWLNLAPMFARAKVGQRLSFRPRTVNLLIGSGMLLVIVGVGGWMIAEALKCTGGICD